MFKRVCWSVSPVPLVPSSVIVYRWEVIFTVRWRSCVEPSNAVMIWHVANLYYPHNGAVISALTVCDWSQLRREALHKHWWHWRVTGPRLHIMSSLMNRSKLLIWWHTGELFPINLLKDVTMVNGENWFGCGGNLIWLLVSIDLVSGDNWFGQWWQLLWFVVAIVLVSGEYWFGKYWRLMRKVWHWSKVPRDVASVTTLWWKLV